MEKKEASDAWQHGEVLKTLYRFSFFLRKSGNSSVQMKQMPFSDQLKNVCKIAGYISVCDHVLYNKLNMQAQLAFRCLPRLQISSLLFLSSLRNGFHHPVGNQFTSFLTLLTSLLQSNIRIYAYKQMIRFSIWSFV